MKGPVIGKLDGLDVDQRELDAFRAALEEKPDAELISLRRDPSDPRHLSDAEWRACTWERRLFKCCEVAIYWIPFRARAPFENAPTNRQPDVCPVCDPAGARRGDAKALDELARSVVTEAPLSAIVALENAQIEDGAVAFGLARLQRQLDALEHALVERGATLALERRAMPSTVSARPMLERMYEIVVDAIVNRGDEDEDIVAHVVAPSLEIALLNIESVFVDGVDVRFNSAGEKLCSACKGRGREFLPNFETETVEQATCTDCGGTGKA